MSAWHNTETVLHSVQSDSPALCESCWLLRHFRLYSTSVLLTFYWYVKWQRNGTVKQEFSRNCLVKVTPLLCMKDVYVTRCKCKGTDDLSLLGCDTFIWRLVPVPSASFFLDQYNWDYIPMTHHHIPEDLNPRQQCCENVTLCAKNCCYVESEPQRKTVCEIVCCFELSAVLCVIVKSAQ